jgi:predicted nucleic acid-binding protein
VDNRGADQESKAQGHVTRAVLLDTSAWVAAAVPSQTKHAQPKLAYTQAVRQGFRIVLTPMVLGESQALFMKLLGRTHALAALDGVMRDPTHTLLALDDELVRAAVAKWLVPYREQQFSLCDAVSFEVMTRERITRALAIDQRFAVAGFEIIR